jgi:hypothetical protein
MGARLLAVHPVLMSSDVNVSIAFYERLGFTCLFRDNRLQPRYAAVERDGAQLHLQWQGPDQWEAKIDRPTYRFPVSDVDQLHAEYQSRVRGQDITTVWDTAWGTREFHVRDPDLNGLQFYVSLSP